MKNLFLIKKKVTIPIIFNNRLLKWKLFETEGHLTCGMLSCWCAKRPGEGTQTQQYYKVDTIGHWGGGTGEGHGSCITVSEVTPYAENNYLNNTLHFLRRKTLLRNNACHRENKTPKQNKTYLEHSKHFLSPE